MKTLFDGYEPWYGPIPPRSLSLDQAFIAEDGLVEITPESMGIRKIELDAGKRAILEKRTKD